MTGWNHNGRYNGGFPSAVHRQAERTLPKHCAHCNTTQGPLQLDHILNQAAGGTHHISNAQWLCVPCHTDKTTRERAAGITARKQRLTLPTEDHPGAPQAGVGGGPDRTTPRRRTV